MSEWVVLLHVAVSFWFVAGLLGRNVTMAEGQVGHRSRHLEELVDLSGRFERLMVIPGSFGVLVLGCSPPGPRVSRSPAPTTGGCSRR